MDANSASSSAGAKELPQSRKRKVNFVAVDKELTDRQAIKISRLKGSGVG